MSERPFVYRFVRDLRLDDHAGLAKAASSGPILPLLVLDHRLEARLSRSPRRAVFFCHAVAALDAELRERGSHLVVRRGSDAAAIKAVAHAVGAAGVAWSCTYDSPLARGDRHLQAELEEAGLRALPVHDAPAISPEETAAARSVTGQAYRAFAPYFDVWRNAPIPSYEQPLLQRFVATDLRSEPLPEPREFGASDAFADAGAAAGKRALDRFMRESLLRYGLAAAIPADDATSHLSAHLSFGTISARRVVRTVRDRMDDPFLLGEERASLRLFAKALARRDFFTQLAWFHPETQREPLQEKMRGFPFSRTHGALEAWLAGTTGFPLVDAGIRQLHATGWMHPHVRAVAASFLCFDLGVDWRVGAAAWDRWLVEDDAAAATGNWQWIAGVGADMAQYPRIYNPQRQRQRYDPHGTYVRRWIRELERVPVSAWHGMREDSAQLPLALFDGDAYPPPVLDHERAAGEFLRRYRSFVL